MFDPDNEDGGGTDFYGRVTSFEPSIKIPPTTPKTQTAPNTKGRVCLNGNLITVLDVLAQKSSDGSVSAHGLSLGQLTYVEAARSAKVRKGRSQDARKCRTVHVVRRFSSSHTRDSRETAESAWRKRRY